MELQLIVLVLFTIILEFLVVGWTLAVSQKRKLLAALLGALIEPVKIISIIFVIELDNRWLGVLLVAAACGLGNYLTLALFEKFENKKRKHNTGG